MDVVRLSVPGTLLYRDVAVRTVASLCKLAAVELRASQGRRDSQVPGVDHDVVSAFGEAFNNVVIHGYKDRPVGPVEIEVELSASEIVVRVRDFGWSYDFMAVPEPKLDELPESGMGVFIIRSCMDDVSYVPGVPNVLCMTKYLRRGSSDRPSVP